MKVLITGATGQLGQALMRVKPLSIAGAQVELIATSRAGGPGLLALDLSDYQACRNALFELRPDWLINAGAYTAVDRAESEPERAMAINAGAPRAFAEAISQLNHGKILQISTDFVFDGYQSVPYQPDQLTQPQCVYGASKAAGEAAIHELDLSHHGHGFILRTSWLYGPTGHNFFRTMLRLHDQNVAVNRPLPVVADQVGCPTSVQGLAVLCWDILAACASDLRLPPVLHWSDAGVASWYDFAVAIGELASASGLLKQPAVVVPIRSSEYPTAAQRPSYSLLDSTETCLVLKQRVCHWRSALSSVVDEVAALRLV